MATENKFIKSINQVAIRPDSLYVEQAIGSSRKPIYIDSEGKPQEISITIPENPEFTDSKVTGPDTHYSPATNDAYVLNANDIDNEYVFKVDAPEENLSFVVGVLRDARGHITGINTSTISVSALAGKSDTLAGYGITDAYTKDEVDSKLTTVFKYKGSVASYQELISLDEKNIGDVYNISDIGSNYAWTGTEWDKLSETVNLDGKQDKLTESQMSILNSDIGDIFNKIDSISIDGTPLSITDKNVNISTQDFLALKDGDGNVITETYIKKDDFTRLTEAEIDYICGVTQEALDNII